MDEVELLFYHVRNTYTSSDSPFQVQDKMSALPNKSLFSEL